MELINEPYWLADYTFSLGASVFLVGLLNLKMSNVIYALCFSNLILSLSYSPILTQWQDRKKKKHSENLTSVSWIYKKSKVRNF